MTMELAEVELFTGGALRVDLTAGLAKEELERRVVVAWRGGEVCSRALAFYLADMEARRVHLELGYPSAVEFATKRLGMSKGRARDLLMAGRKLQELPRLDEAFSSGQVSWSKARRLARVATPETEQAWIDRAKELTHEQVDALTVLAQEGDWPASDGGLPRLRMVKRLVLSAHQSEIWERVRERIAEESGKTVVTDEQVVDAMLRKYFEGAGQVTGLVVAGGARAQSGTGGESEGMTLALRERVIQRDGGGCRHCGSRSRLMAHHVVWRSQGGATREENLVTLCSRCHALVHDEYLFVSGTPGRWRFADRRGAETRGLEGVGAQLRTVRPVRTGDGSGGREASRKYERGGVEADGGLRPEEVPTVPEVVDQARWCENEHVFTWNESGDAVKLKRRRKRKGRR